eukprot:g4265.t1
MHRQDAARARKAAAKAAAAPPPSGARKTAKRRKRLGLDEDSDQSDVDQDEEGGRAPDITDDSSCSDGDLDDLADTLEDIDERLVDGHGEPGGPSLFREEGDADGIEDADEDDGLGGRGFASEIATDATASARTFSYAAFSAAEKRAQQDIFVVKDPRAYGSSSQRFAYSLSKSRTLTTRLIEKTKAEKRRCVMVRVPPMIREERAEFTDELAEYQRRLQEWEEAKAANELEKASAQKVKVARARIRKEKGPAMNRVGVVQQAQDSLQLYEDDEDDLFATEKSDDAGAGRADAAVAAEGGGGGGGANSSSRSNKPPTPTATPTPTCRPAADDAGNEEDEGPSMVASGSGSSALRAPAALAKVKSKRRLPPKPKYPARYRHRLRTTDEIPDTIQILDADGGEAGRYVLFAPHHEFATSYRFLYIEYRWREDDEQENPFTVAEKYREWHLPTADPQIRKLLPGKFCSRFQLVSSRVLPTIAVAPELRKIEPDIRSKATSSTYSYSCCCAFL